MYKTPHTGIPGLTNPTVLGALFSLTATGLYSSYLIPILLRVTVSKNTFMAAEINLGKYSIPIGIISVIWCIFMIVILCLPQAAPLSIDNMNYSPIALGIVLLFAFLSWIISARHWFKGLFLIYLFTYLFVCLIITSVINFFSFPFFYLLSRGNYMLFSIQFLHLERLTVLFYFFLFSFLLMKLYGFFLFHFQLHLYFQ